MFRRLLLAGVLAHRRRPAQRGGGGGDETGGMGGGGMDRGGGMGGGGGGVMARKPTKPEQFADKLKLNKEQREETATILAAARERSGAVRAELDDRRAKIAGAFIDGKSPEEVSKITADYAAVAAQMTKIEADAFAKNLRVVEAEPAVESGTGVRNHGWHVQWRCNPAAWRGWNGRRNGSRPWRGQVGKADETEPHNCRNARTEPRLSPTRWRRRRRPWRTWRRRRRYVHDPSDQKSSRADERRVETLEGAEEGSQGPDG